MWKTNVRSPPRHSLSIKSLNLVIKKVSGKITTVKVRFVHHATSPRLKNDKIGLSFYVNAFCAFYFSEIKELFMK